MTTSAEISHGFRNIAELSKYVIRQMENLVPDATPQDSAAIRAHTQAALKRMGPILDAAVGFEPGKFNHLHSLQYASFIYLLANEIWLRDGSNATSERLFLLNRFLNGLDIHYKIPLPRVFVVGHGLGTVLVNTTYGDNFVFFHGVTVGRLGNKVPTIGDNVVLFPGSMVLGNSRIGNRSVVSAGTVISNTDIPDGSIVFSDATGVKIKTCEQNYSGLFLRQT